MYHGRSRHLYRAMKFLTFAVFITFILDNDGTIDAKSIEDYELGERIELFKKYALQLVNAAIPSLQYNKDIMERACECTPIVEQEDGVNPIIAILATASIAKHYDDGLQQLQQTSDYSQIADGLLKNIGKILVVLDGSSKPRDTTPIDKILKRYVLKSKQGPSYVASAITDNNKNFRSVINCYRSMISLAYRGSNQAFYKKLTTGFDIASTLLRDDVEGREIDSQQRDLLCARIQQVRASWLIAPDYNYLTQRVKEFLESLDANTDSDLE